MRKGSKNTKKGIHSSKDIDTFLINRPIVRLTEYINARTDVGFKCLDTDCGYEWYAKARYVCYRGDGCRRCSGKLKLTNQEVDKRLEGMHIERLENYINLKTPMKCKCSIESCGHIWYPYPSNILHHKFGCPKCAGVAKLTNEEIDNRLKHKNIIRLEEYINNKIYILFQCCSCKRKWKTSTDTLLNKGIGCPFCNIYSKNETIIYDTLKNNDIEFIHQYRLSKIYNGEKQRIRIDFYIPKKNIIIEYNGAQHYSPIRFNNISKQAAETNFIKQKNRDNYVRNFCKLHNIQLIEIDGRAFKYKVLEKYLEDKIINKLI